MKKKRKKFIKFFSVSKFMNRDLGWSSKHDELKASNTCCKFGVRAGKAFRRGIYTIHKTHVVEHAIYRNINHKKIISAKQILVTQAICKSCVVLN